MKTLFGLESDEKAEEYTVSDAIDAITLESEINESLNEIDDIHMVISQARYITDMIEVSSELDKVALESDDITPVVAKMSVASLNQINNVLGLTYSLEDIDNDNRLLTISLEEKENILTKIWEKIKAFLNKIMLFIRKTIFRVIEAVSSQIKKGGKLMNLLINVKNTNEWTPEESNNIRERFSGKLYYYDTDFTYSFLKRLVKDINTEVTIPKKLVDIANTYVVSKEKDWAIGNIMNSLNFGVKPPKKKYGIIFNDGKTYDTFLILSDRRYVGVISIHGKKIMYDKINVVKSCYERKIKSITSKEMISILKDSLVNPNIYKNGLNSIDSSVADMKDKLVKSKDGDTVERTNFSTYRDITMITPKAGLDEVIGKYHDINDILWLANLIIKRNTVKTKLNVVEHNINIGFGNRG